jgi:hypothetical protein
MKASRSLKILLHEGMDIPREFNYISPTSDRAKVIRIVYDGQPWHCRKPCDMYHTSRFCPARDDPNKRDGSPEGGTKKSALLLSSSETRLCDATDPSCGIKVVKWSGGKIGHLANIIKDEEIGKFDQVVIIGGLNDISGDIDHDKQALNHHVQMLNKSLKKSRPKKTFLVRPYVCPEQITYSDARRALNSQLRRCAMELRGHGLDITFLEIPEDLFSLEDHFSDGNTVHLNQAGTDHLLSFSP